jgi:predicted dehydrogenase
VKKLRFALFGSGFRARFQLQAWHELKGVECGAVFNRTRSTAEQFARDLNVPAVYDDANEMLKREKPDFVDIVTNPSTFSQFVQLAAGHGIPVICQRPMAPSVAVAERMVKFCREANVPFFIHENWRWQTT